MHTLFDRALSAARQLRASDIHLKAGLGPILRVDGELRTLKEAPPMSREFIQSLAYSLLNDRRREILERTGDVALSITAPDGSRQRLQIWQHRGGTSIAIRLVPAQAPALERLDLPPVVAGLVARGAGLVLVAGEAGSGKTTTVAALVDHLGAERACHVVTIEDPVEILLKHRSSIVVQREVGLDAPSTASALRAALRQDVDVLVIGDLREADAVDLAVGAAETGRLVVAAVGARDAWGAVARVLELGASHERTGLRTRLAGSLRGVVAQQLVPRADGKGRAAAAEVLLVDDEARRALRAVDGEPAVRAALAAGRPAGSQSFDASLVALARTRRVTREAAVARAADPEAVRALLAADGPQGDIESPDDAPDDEPVEDDARPD